MPLLLSIIILLPQVNDVIYIIALYLYAKDIHIIDSTQQSGVLSVIRLWRLVAPAVVTMTSSGAAWDCRVITVNMSPF